MMRFVYFSLLLIVSALASPLQAAANGPPMANAVVLIIRHADKPEDGSQLSPDGERRAEAYVQYFNPFKAAGDSVTPDMLIATADSGNSERPRLTLEPLSKAIGVSINTEFANHQEKDLAAYLFQAQHGRVILIAWHHGRIPQLIAALGGDPFRFFPDGRWPDDVYDKVIVLRFDAAGQFASQQMVQEPF
ncbi:flagellar basal body-associated protein FliL [Aestuariivirga sp.]|uniref:flagellar basal body-associated protein FliL n=1 Tax=Aestuariivirga sp. TaxID=2650926 RepID=UPI0039E545D3